MRRADWICDMEMDGQLLRRALADEAWKYALRAAVRSLALYVALASSNLAVSSQGSTARRGEIDVPLLE